MAITTIAIRRPMTAARLRPAARTSLSVESSYCSSCARCGSCAVCVDTPNYLPRGDESATPASRLDRRSVLRVGERQHDPERRALAWRAVDLDLAAMCLGQARDDRQPETRTTCRTSARRIRTVEALEDAVPLGRGETGTAVGHLEQRPAAAAVALGAHPDRDRRAVGG